MLGGWNASWPSGTRVAITFTTSVSCGTGLTVTTSVTSILHAAGGAAESTAPTAQGNTPGTIASSATSTRFARPHHALRRAQVDLDPAPQQRWHAGLAGSAGGLHRRRHRDRHLRHQRTELHDLRPARSRQVVRATRARGRPVGSLPSGDVLLAMTASRRCRRQLPGPCVVRARIPLASTGRSRE